jgi:hypothetical protein
VVADPQDNVAGDCESVDRGVQPPPPVSEPQASTTSTVPAPVETVGTVAGGAPKVLILDRRARVRRGKPSIRLACPANASTACSGALRLTAVTGSRRRAKVSIGRGSFSIRPGQKVTVKTTLSAKGKRLLASLRKLRVTVTATTRSADGKTVISSGTLRLKA